MSAVIADAEAVTAEQTAKWRRDGYQAAAIVLDERHKATDYRRAAQSLGAAGLDLYYWIEVARNAKVADAHPDWMASLGLHADWHERFPKTPPPKPGEVPKAYRFGWQPVRHGGDGHLHAAFRGDASEDRVRLLRRRQHLVRPRLRQRNRSMELVDRLPNR